MFGPTSRYRDVPENVIVDARGRAVRYKLMRRIVTEAQVQALHMVAQGDRPDLIAYRYYREPELFWRICDVNQAMAPSDLVAEPRRILLVPLPR
jgi:hypothetical protein